MNSDKFYFIFISFWVLGSCKTDQKPNIPGDYWDSNLNKISYYIPKDFQLVDILDEQIFLSYASTITNGKLKQKIKEDRLSFSVYPETQNFIYFSKEDSSNYTNIYISEIPYIRINDLIVDYFKKYRDDAFYASNRKNDSLKITLNAENFINKPHYQLVYSDVKISTSLDTLYLSQYITSKYYQTFIIETESTEKFNFYPYLKETKFNARTN